MIILVEFEINLKMYITKYLSSGKYANRPILYMYINKSKE